MPTVGWASPALAEGHEYCGGGCTYPLPRMGSPICVVSISAEWGNAVEDISRCIRVSAKPRVDGENFLRGEVQNSGREIRLCAVFVEIGELGYWLAGGTIPFMRRYSTSCP